MKVSKTPTISYSAGHVLLPSTRIAMRQFETRTVFSMSWNKQVSLPTPTIFQIVVVYMPFIQIKK